MALFEFEAFSPTGEKIVSITDAETVEEAKKKLFAKQLLITKIAVSKQRSFAKLSKEKQLAFFHELGKLLTAGIPLYDSLLILKEKEGDTLKKIVADLCDRVQQGHFLSEALLRHKHSFDILHISMVKNAEKSGLLVQTLEKITLHLSKQIALLQKLRSTLSYPLLLLSFCFVVIISLLYYVIPALKPLFEGKKMQLSTKIVIQISNFAVLWKSYFLVLFVITISLGIFCYFFPPWKEKIQQKIQKWFCKNFFMKIAFVRVSTTIATLLESGLSLLESLELAKDTTKNDVFIKILAQASTKLSQGKKLSEAFILPPIFSQEMVMLSIAEESGNISGMFHHIAKNNQEEIDKFITKITTLLQPILLLVLGVIVTSVVLSILLPLTDVHSFADI